MKKYNTLIFFVALIFMSTLVISGDKSKISVKEIEPYFYCAVEMTGSYDQHEDAFTTLYEQAGMQGLGSDFEAFGIYINDPNQTPANELKWELGFELQDSVKVKEPLKHKKWNYSQMAGLLYEGSFSSPEFAAAHVDLFQWISANGYTPVGPMMEKYVEMTSQNSEGEWLGKIRITVPVRK